MDPSELEVFMDTALRNMLVFNDIDIVNQILNILIGYPRFTDYLVVVAAYHNKLDMLNFLIGRGGDINALITEEENLGFCEGVSTYELFLPNKTPLILACEQGHFNIVQYLVNNGANINLRYELTKTPLMVVCKSGNFDIAQYLINNGADVNMRNNRAETALMLACQNDNVDIVNSILNTGNCEINAIDIFGQNALFFTSNPVIVDLLLEYKIDVHVRDGDLRSTFERAFRDNDIPSITKIIKAGANPNSERLRYLILAVKEKDYGIVETLLKLGANPNLNGDKTTALIEASKRCDYQMTKILLEFGANPNAEADSTTPLLEAIDKANYQIVKKLLKFGANPNSPNINGQTPLYMAENVYKYKVIAKLLKDNGAR